MLKFISVSSIAFGATQFDLKNCTIKLRGGTIPSQELTIKVADGNVTYDEQRQLVYIKDRGKLSDAHLGDEIPMDVSIDIIWDFLKANSTTDITPEDALKQRGGAASWVSSDPDICAPYCVDIEIWYVPCASLKTEKIILPEFRWEKIMHNAKTSMLAVSGKCNATQATIVRGQGSAT